MPGTLPSEITWVSEAHDDHVAIRGTDHRPASSSASGASTGSSAVITNCLPIGNGQLRCYTVDPSAPLIDGIAALSVDPATGVPGAEAIAASVAYEFRRLPLVSGGIVIQPPQGWTLVNVETIVLTDPTPQTFEVTLLGVDVTVVARPTGYSWSFGDDSPALVTADPGAPWPDQRLTHVYRSAGQRSITLTTQWSGAFRVAGTSAWLPITGTAVTVEAAPPLDVREAANTLVSGP